jgi:toxin ParE1/3/4
MLAVQFRPEATQDVSDIVNLLESRSPGRGQTFLLRLNDVVQQLQSMPRLFGIVYRNVRFANIPKSSYVVYYRVFTDRIEIIAVQHRRRGASGWVDRI